MVSYCAKYKAAILKYNPCILCASKTKILYDYKLKKYIQQKKDCDNCLLNEMMECLIQAYKDITYFSNNDYKYIKNILEKVTRKSIEELLNDTTH